MPLSEHEETQFKNLTADFTFDDPSILKVLKKKDKPKPSWSLILLVMAVIAILIAVAGRLIDNLPMLALGGISAVGLVMASMMQSEEEIYMAWRKKEQEERTI